MHLRWTLTTAYLVLTLTACSTAVAGSSSPDGSGRVGVQDGRIDDAAGIPLDDGEHPAIRNLDPALLAAVREAGQDAQRQRNVRFKVTSGWRSKAYQQELLDEAVGKYGSLAEARRFVNTPERSTHVTGKAVDIGPTDAADWLVQRGSRYGLCQAYANEMWHFELLTTPGGTCPRPRGDAAG
jgi:D-alanyl-D-alanine carboxypeptidase